MKKIISQLIQQNTIKCHHNDYTDVSTENSSQHSLDSSFQQKSSPQNNPHHNIVHDIKDQPSINTMIEEESQQSQKSSKIQFYKKSIEWLQKRYKRFKIKIQTLYVAISYLIKFISLKQQINYKYDTLSAVCLLLAAKFNEIYVPSIKSILNSLDFFTTKKDILLIQQEILQLFDFDMSIERNSYMIIWEFFKDEQQQKRKNAERLLFLAINNPEALQYGEMYLGLSIVYLLKPQVLANNANMNVGRQKMKKIALIVYKMYKQKKAQLGTTRQI